MKQAIAQRATTCNVTRAIGMAQRVTAKMRRRATCNATQVRATAGCNGWMQRSVATVATAGCNGRPAATRRQVRAEDVSACDRLQVDVLLPARSSHPPLHSPRDRCNGCNRPLPIITNRCNRPLQPTVANIQLLQPLQLLLNRQSHPNIAAVATGATDRYGQPLSTDATVVADRYIRPLSTVPADRCNRPLLARAAASARRR